MDTKSTKLTPVSSSAKIVCIILCDGEASRWNNFLGVKKHFIKLEGEVLLRRTVRLFKKYCKYDHDIYIVASSDEYLLPGTKLYTPNHNLVEYGEADKYLCSEKLWNKRVNKRVIKNENKKKINDTNVSYRTIVLLGDVWFSEKAMKTIVGYKGDTWKVFGRVDSNFHTGCLGGELFAQSFLDIHIDEHKKKLIELGNLYKKTGLKKASGWGHLNMMLGLDVAKHHIKEYLNSSLFTEINDFTNDFDFPADYNRWIDSKNKLFNPRITSIYNIGKTPESWETILESIEQLKDDEQHHACYFMASYAYQEVKKLEKTDHLKNKKKWQEILLRLTFEFSVIGYYVERISFALLALNKVLFNELTDDEMRSFSTDNLVYYVKNLEYTSVEPINSSDVGDDLKLFKSKYRGHPIVWRVKPVNYTKETKVVISEEKTGNHYFHRFLLLNNKNKCLGISTPFFFKTNSGERCLNFQLLNDTCHITVKIKHNSCLLFKIPLATVLEMINELTMNLDV